MLNSAVFVNGKKAQAAFCDKSLFLKMAKEEPFRRLSLQEYGRYINQSHSAPASPLLVRRQAFVQQSPPSGIEYFQRTGDSGVRKYSLEECSFVEPSDHIGSYYVPGHSSPALFPVYSVPSPTLYTMNPPTVMQATGYRPVQEVQPFYALPASQPIPVAVENIVYQPVTATLQTNPNYPVKFHQSPQQDEYDDVQQIQESMQGLCLKENVQGSTQQQKYLGTGNHVSQEPQISQQQSSIDQSQSPMLRRRSGAQAVPQVQNVQLVHPIQLSSSPGMVYGVQGQMIGSTYAPVISRVNQPDTITEHVPMNSVSDPKPPESCLRKESGDQTVKKKKVSFEDDPPKRLKIIRVQKGQTAESEQAADGQCSDSGKSDSTDGYEPYVALRRASTGSRPQKSAMARRSSDTTKQRRNSVCPMTAYNLR